MKKNFTGDSKIKESDWASVKSVLMLIAGIIISKINLTILKKIKSIIKKSVKTIQFLFMKLSYLTPVNCVGSRIQEFYSLIIKILKKKNGTSQR